MRVYMREYVEFMPSGLIKSALNLGKKYVYRAINDILHDWSMDDIFEDNWMRQ